MSVLYLDHFGLSTDPFRITPDTGLFFTGGQRGDILEGLIVASMHDEGIVSVVGEIGMGKTMLSRMLLERLRPLPSDTVYLANPVFDRDEILGAIARDLMPEPPQGNRSHMLAALESVLIERYSQGRRVVVVIDEAHSMPATTLEEIRLLSNLETTQNKLLKIVLFGQPELDELLAAPQLRQVKDRISHRFELQPLNAQEASAYLMFRLHKAGWKGGELFDAAALRLLVQASEGRTRKLNMLADKSMLAAYAEGVPQVGIDQVHRAVGDSLPTSRRAALFPANAGDPSASLWRRFAPAGLGVLVALGAGYLLGSGGGMDRRERVAVTQPVTLPVVPEPASMPAANPSPSSPSPLPLAPVAQAAPGPVLAVAPTPPGAPAAGPASPVPAPVPPSPAATRAPIAEPALVAKLKDNALAVRMQVTDEFIARPSTRGFTVQLLSQRAPRDAEVLAMANEVQAALNGAAQPAVPVLVHNRLYQRQLFHALYAGHFETRADALEFIQSAPGAIRRYNPVVRSLDAIRKEPVP
ncbi:AAA family ATPase [Polaromonas sp.]|uniref:ExeA family protein n=1 Tax=Polaromonas sp. TaxID=1869339 RepID=UPI002487EDC2|nr:AAA family ATPase [Polaromonas sp.]MDI1341535.1 AAA family ATPase [Polaromonas sp.]